MFTYKILSLVMCLLFQRPQVPVLCYHNMHASGGHPDNVLYISPAQFSNQMQWLNKNGYHSITPDELYAYLHNGATLPAKAVMISFDDTHEEHYTVAAPILKRYGFRGVFFIMTVSIGKPHYMTAAQIKSLSDSGHIIACHTWDHPNLSKVSTYDTQKQLVHPKQLLEKITGKTVSYLGYPFGGWNEQVVKDVKAAGFKAAFQLDRHSFSDDPLYSIRRIMISGSWSGEQLEEKMKTAFH
ncbi:polysaccharide deacetylase family protein [Chitinophaga oryziterrae]|uniref:Polysaccharide deacetylase family protein n=1 Tax=Chitinophaga oryziterrae TaxID=1031224 RepID=A0A6N8JFV0_9BACT|nr:polysaccharide deacetylase family protein [Chitinophaga oryziterrae]MVT43012.1 polysaccharide deacetylase family protein [Chitinophaga oryziterrae]